MELLNIPFNGGSSFDVEVPVDEFKLKKTVDRNGVKGLACYNDYIYVSTGGAYLLKYDLELNYIGAVDGDEFAFLSDAYRPKFIHPSVIYDDGFADTNGALIFNWERKQKTYSYVPDDNSINLASAFKGLNLNFFAYDDTSSKVYHYEYNNGITLKKTLDIPTEYSNRVDLFITGNNSYTYIGLPGENDNQGLVLIYKYSSLKYVCTSGDTNDKYFGGGIYCASTTYNFGAKVMSQNGFYDLDIETASLIKSFPTGYMGFPYYLKSFPLLDSTFPYLIPLRRTGDNTISFYNDNSNYMLDTGLKIASEASGHYYRHNWYFTFDNGIAKFSKTELRTIDTVTYNGQEMYDVDFDDSTNGAEIVHLYHKEQA